MFKFLHRKDPSRCPVPEERRQWIDQVFVWLFDTFGKDKTINRRILVPHYADFPIQYNGSDQSIWETLKIVADQMEVVADDIHLDFYSQGPSRLNSEGRFTPDVFLEEDKTETYSAGMYWGRQEDNKYHIWLEEKTLGKPEKIVAALAHEIAHIKLLDEIKIEENDEEITDFTTLAFGLGVFNANTSLMNESGLTHWAYSKQGYLTVMDWGYALALLAYLRKEKDPAWFHFLSSSVQFDFKEAALFIEHHPDMIMR